MLAYLSIHYMFQEVNYELQETDNVQGQIYKHVFAPNGGFCVYHLSNIFVMYRTKIEQIKISTNNYICLLLSVSSPYISMNKQICSFFCNNRRNLSQHEIKNKTKTLMAFDKSYFKLGHSQLHDVS